MVLPPLAISGLTLAGIALARSTTVQLFIPGADTQPLVGSVIGSDKSATTYAIECKPGTNEGNCGFPGVFTLTEGPTTALYALSDNVEGHSSSTEVAFTGYFDCSLDASSAVCKESFGGKQANFPGSTTETFTGTDFTYMPVIITAGVLSSSVPSKTSAKPTVESTSTCLASRCSNATGTITIAAHTGVNSTTTSTARSTGAAPVITRNAGWVVGGAVVAVVFL